MVEKRFRVLRIISAIYKVLGVLVLLLAIVTLVLAIGMKDAQPGLVALAAGAGAALSLYAFGEGIQLFISLEENTRQSNALLRALGRALTRDEGPRLE